MADEILAGAASLARLLAESRAAVAFTGAGISTESGLPDFRSAAGLWRGVDPARVASSWALRHNPHEFYRFYRARLERLGKARPNAAHQALAALEDMAVLRCVITQNVDGLHQAAGSRRVLELHGDMRRTSCCACRALLPIEVLERQVAAAAWDDESGAEAPGLPRCPSCGGLLRPNVVLFGEALPAGAFADAGVVADSCDAMLVVGSSLEVWPASGLPQRALAGGAALAIVNLSPTPLDAAAAVVVRGPAGAVLPAALAEVRRLREADADGGEGVV